MDDRLECDGGSARHVCARALHNLERAMRLTRVSCTIPCKEQAGNREGKPAVISYSCWLVLAWLRSAKMRRAPAPHAEEHRANGRMDAPTASAALRSMRAKPIARPHPSRRAHAPSNSRNVFGVRAPQDEKARAGWSGPCIFLFFCRFGIFHPRSHDLKHTHLLVPAAHVCARVLQ